MLNQAVKISIDFVALIAVYVFVLYKRWKHVGNDILIIRTLLYVYLSGVLYFTLMPIITSLPFVFNHPYNSINLIPFDDYFANRGDTVRQIILNIIMMIPFGFLLPIIKKRKLGFCLMSTFILSLCIELLQPLISGTRSADITDLITNTLGGLLGYLLYLIFRPLVSRILLRINSK